jgi:hypothetical protein
MKNAVFLDVTPCGLGFLRSVHRLLITANVGPSSSILVTLMMGGLSSSEKWFLKEPHDVTYQKTAFFSIHINYTHIPLASHTEHVPYRFGRCTRSRYPQTGAAYCRQQSDYTNTSSTLHLATFFCGCPALRVGP